MRVDRDDGGIQVMEHREPPRIAAGDRRFGGVTEEPGGRFRLRTFDPASNRRRIEPLRVALLSVSALAITAAIYYIASRATSSAVGWLHRQSQYQLAFDQIRLVHEPPAWYRGGAREFLARVRHDSGESEHISQLDVRPERLALAFKIDPWVEEVVRVAYAPGRISVDLRFRQPVAWVWVVAPDQRTKLAGRQKWIIDGEGRVLASEDVDVEPLGTLLKITGEELAAPADPRAGVVWKSKSSGGEIEQVDERIVAAGKLARFLTQEGRVDSTKAALRMIEIIVPELSDFRNRGLFVLNAEGAEFCWGKAPGSEGPGEPSSDAKWQMLRRWEETTPKRTLADGDYWEFSRKGLSHECPHNPSHRPPAATPTAFGKQTASGKQEDSG
jgi:hypothetical protein